jgi:hypothetical protein
LLVDVDFILANYIVESVHYANSITICRCTSAIRFSAILK